MNLYEFVMMVFYVGFCTGILSLGVHFTEKSRAREYDAKTRKLEVVMTNLENPLDKKNNISGAWTTSGLAYKMKKLKAGIYYREIYDVPSIMNKFIELYKEVVS